MRMNWDNVRQQIDMGLAAVVGFAFLVAGAFPGRTAAPPHTSAWGYRHRQPVDPRKSSIPPRKRHRTPARHDIAGDGISNSGLRRSRGWRSPASTLRKGVNKTASGSYAHSAGTLMRKPTTVPEYGFQNSPNRTS